MIWGMVRALLFAVILAPAMARADRDLCAKNAKHHGTPIDLDLQQADIHDVLRLLTDVGRTNLVVGDNVAGKVTLRLRRVAWDAAVCTIAAVHHLTVTVQDNILLVRRDP
ncbi:MAG: hypothetical protein JWO36_6264 [Myxococcales bacterium]|nr:hypothetical protein [Myxococcales bacterium]